MAKKAPRDNPRLLAARRQLLTRTIVQVDRLTEAEMEDNGWCGEPPLRLTLDDGTVLFAQCDPEGNGPGALCVTDREITSIY